MLGNDVVDLRDPETSPTALHPRFDERVFEREERAALERSASPRRLRWTLWAAKESSFKAERQIDGRVVFSPSRFVVHRLGESAALVVHGGRRFRVSLAERDDLVHAVAVAEEAAGACIADVIRIPHVVSATAVRRFAIEALAARLGVDAARLAIDPCRKIPRLAVDGTPRGILLSLSHHGEGIGFAALVPGAGEAAWDANGSHHPSLPIASAGVVT